MKLAGLWQDVCLILNNFEKELSPNSREAQKLDPAFIPADGNRRDYAFLR